MHSFQLLSWTEVEHVLVPLRLRLPHFSGLLINLLVDFAISFSSLSIKAALFFHYKGRQMVKIIEGRHLGSTQSIDRWLADKKSGKKARTDTAHTYFLEQSKLQTQLLFFSWGFQSFKAVYIWGECFSGLRKFSPSYHYAVFLRLRSHRAIGDHGLPHLHDHPLPQRAQQAQISGVDSEQRGFHLQQDDFEIERVEGLNESNV